MSEEVEESPGVSHHDALGAASSSGLSQRKALATPVAVPALSADEAGWPPPRVLVVDDDEANRKVLARRLSRHGQEVEVAADGQAALDAVARTTFDLILLDVMMPGLSGLEVLDRLRRDHPATELPIIMATASDKSEDVVAALRAGANDYVVKPLDFAVVLARVQTQLSLRRAVQQVRDLEKHLSERNADLEAAAVRTRRELELAAKVQSTYLPKSPEMQIGHAKFAWHYQPCEQLAGDALNICRLDDDHTGFYVLDVTGHGVAASLTAVSAARLLAPAHDPDTILVDTIANNGALPTKQLVSPAEVARRLNRRFSFNDDTAQFLTCFYAILCHSKCQLTYVSGGHPSPILVSTDRSVRTLSSTGLPIGVGDKYDERTINLSRGDRLYIYSDGVTETKDAASEEFTEKRLIELLRCDRAAANSIAENLAMVIENLVRWSGSETPGDDISLLALECA